MQSYGEPVDLVSKVPKTLPPYAEDTDLVRLLRAVEDRPSPKGNIERDRVLLTVALKTGLRRAELAALTTGDIHVFVNQKGTHWWQSRRGPPMLKRKGSVHSLHLVEWAEQLDAKRQPGDIMQ